MIRLLLALLLIGASGPTLAQDGPQAEHYLGRSVPITLREAVLLALQNNLDIEIARLNPGVASEQVGQAEGAFDPLLTASYEVQHDEIPIASVLQGTNVAELEEDVQTTRSGFRGMLPFGLEYASRYELTRLETNSDTRSQLDPQWRAGWVNELTLPLLRDLILNQESVTVRLRRINESISNEDFRRELTDRILEVETRYWDLAATRATERVAVKSLETAQDLLSQTEIRYEVGVVSRVAVRQAEAGVAEREVDAIVARNRAANAQDTLLNTVLVPDIARFADTELVPDDPAFVEYTAELDSSLRMALAHRPEVIAARRRVDEAKIQLAFAENQRLPTLDLKASYTLNGLSGSPKPGATSAVKSGSESAHDAFFRHDASAGYMLGGELSIPLGNTTARALVAQRRIELRRTRTQLKSQEQEVILEVRREVRGLTSARDAVGASERRRIAQEETLRAEQEKLRLGDSTPHDVLEFEEDLAEAERSLIASLKSYRDAIARVERGRATLLESRGISVEAALHR